MFFRFGPAPGKNVPHSTRRFALLSRTSVLIATGLLSISALGADQRLPLTITEAEDLALRNEPGFHALQARANALREQSVSSGQLPDPSLRLGLANFPISGGGFSTEGMTQAQLGIRQAIPRGRLRSMSTAQYRALANVQSSGANARNQDVLEAARSAWLESFYWQRAEQELSESRPLFEDLLQVTQSLYAVGRKSQSDVLRAELELRRLDDRLIEASRARSSAQGILSEWLGQDAFRSTANKLPGWEQLPPRDDLLESLATNPALQAATATIEARQASVGIAEEKGKPSWALDLGYGYRDGNLPNGEPRSDFVSLSVVVDLPMFKKNRQDRDLAAALSSRSAAVSDRERVTARLQSQLNIEYTRWANLTRRLHLYESDILALSENQAEAAMLAYQSDAGDFLDAIASQIDHLNTRLDHIRIQVERDQSYARLANLGGIPR